VGNAAQVAVAVTLPAETLEMPSISSTSLRGRPSNSISMSRSARSTP